ncbi:MAG: acetyl-CoA carboxylase biotin carboxyl carrier protein [Cellulosilyticaceae bacterium]
MKIETIKELIGEFKTSDLTRLKINAEGFELELEREKEVVYASAGVPITMAAPAQVNSTEVTITTPDASRGSEASGRSITSPMVGTFYLASSPTSKPFVAVGSKVKKGDVVCIIEAMKLMNEVEADQDGEIVEILVSNEDMVEFGQPLFILK